MASPVFTAIGIPARRCIVGTPRRESLPSSMSSCTRKALCSISRPAAAGNASSARPPSARAVAMHERRPQALARAVDEILHEPIQVPLRLPRRYAGRERIGEHARDTSRGARGSPPVPRSRRRLAPRRRRRAGHPAAWARTAAPRFAVGSTMRTSPTSSATALSVRSSASATAWANGATCSSSGRACSSSGDAPRRAWAATCMSESSHGRPAS